MNRRRQFIEENLTEILKDLREMDYQTFTDKYLTCNGVTIFMRWANYTNWKKCIRNAIRITLADYAKYKDEFLAMGISMGTLYTYSIGKSPQTKVSLNKIEKVLGIRLEE